MHQAVTFILLFVFAFETTIPSLGLSDGLAGVITLRMGDMAAGEAEEFSEMETNAKEKEAGIMSSPTAGFLPNGELNGIGLYAITGTFIPAFYRACLDEPPEA